MARRREAAGDEIAHHGPQLAGSQALALDLELEQLGGDVVTRLSAALVDAGVDVVGEGGESFGEAEDAVVVAVGCGKPALDEVLSPRHDLRGVLLGDAEEVHGGGVG